MRGDSLRDFYAKTLAVLGLGLLAGAGAIVDYWPVNEELPTTPAVTGLVASVPAPLVRDLSVEIPAPIVRVSKPKPNDFIAPEHTATVVAIETPTSLAPPPVTLEGAPLPADFVVLETIQAVASRDEFGLETPPLPDSMTEESRRVFGDALRIARERFAAAKVLFNDAVSGAMSGMKGAFRKMSPFFQATTVPGLD